MHKRLFNEASIALTLRPDGPILIKAGDSNADPTRPDMSFVRTHRNGAETVYLPGSSLKGVLRAHCERLARTVQDDKRRLACDPLSEDARESCGRRLDREGKDWSGARRHRESCFVCRLFGNTGLGSHFRVEDAYPPEEPRTEERNGVAIDRVFGSVAVGPFNYETVTGGDFPTTLRLRNFTLAQIGLLALALRDLEQGRVRIGFGKSRGLGVVTARVDALTLRYPLCELADEGRLRLSGSVVKDAGRLYGVGAFLSPEERKDYGYPSDEEISLSESYRYAADGWIGAEVSAPKTTGGGADWHPLGRACAGLWKREAERAPA